MDPRTNQTITAVLIALCAVLFVCLTVSVLLAGERDTAMSQCMISHSADTCNYALR